MRLPLVERGDSAIRRRREAVKRTSVRAVANVGRVDPGKPVAVEGRVEPHERTASAPLTGTECVVAGYERRRPTGEGRFETVERRVGAVPFFVVDDTGRVLVDPGEADEGAGYLDETDPFAVSAGNTRWLAGDEDGEAVRPVEGPAALDPDGEEWLHRVATIGPGDEVYVLGERAGEDDRTRIRRNADREFVVSDLGRAALDEALRRASPDVSRQFLLFAALGVIAVAVVLGVVVIFVVTFLL